MERKQVIRVKHPFSDQVVKMIEVPHISFNDVGLSKLLDEQSSKPETLQSFPVKVQAIRIRWIINTKYGQKLLTEIKNNESLSNYTIPSLKITIEFLYLKIKQVIIMYLLPIYIT